MILTDDNFATIIKALPGTKCLPQYLKMRFSSYCVGNFRRNHGGIVYILAGLPVPFQPVHLLFINLLTRFLPAIAIGMEKAEKICFQSRHGIRNRGILTRELMTARFRTGRSDCSLYHDRFSPYRFIYRQCHS